MSVRAAIQDLPTRERLQDDQAGPAAEFQPASVDDRQLQLEILDRQFPRPHRGERIAGFEADDSARSPIPVQRSDSRQGKIEAAAAAAAHGRALLLLPIITMRMEGLNPKEAAIALGRRSRESSQGPRLADCETSLHEICCG